MIILICCEDAIGFKQSEECDDYEDWITPGVRGVTPLILRPRARYRFCIFASPPEVCDRILQRWFNYQPPLLPPSQAVSSWLILHAGINTFLSSDVNFLGRLVAILPLVGAESRNRPESSGADG